jgi:hypothetical protein
MSYYYPQVVATLRILWEDFQLTSDASKQKVYEVAVLPKSVNVCINDYTTADTFDLELDYKTFPFDPRCIRSCGVTIHMQNMEKLFDRNSDHVVIEPSDDNAIFQGFVDAESITLDEDKRTIKMEGRDFTALLLDSPYLENKPLDLGTPLDKLLESLLRKQKSTEEITVDPRLPSGYVLPTLRQYARDFNQPLAGHMNHAKSDTYWEIIQDLVARAGLIAFIELDKLVLTTPRILYDKKNAKQLIYGKNVKSIEFQRKLGRHKGFNVLVRCMDVSNGRVLTAKIPLEATAAWCRATGVKKKEVTVPVVRQDGTLGKEGDKDVKPAPYITFRLTGVTNKPALIEKGQAIYEEMSRQQLEGTLETKEMLIPEAGVTESEGALVRDEDGARVFDLLKLRVGTPLLIEIDPQDLTEMSRFSTNAARAAFLISREYPADVAGVIASAVGKFSPYFFTKAVTFSMGDDGFRAKIDFINFIELDHAGVSFA